MRKVKAIISLFVAAMLVSTTVSAAAFQDVNKSASYAKAVDYVNSAGLMVGYGDGTFKPDKAVTRAEMATVLCKILGADKNLKKDGSKFFDVPTSHWGNGYVIKAAELGVVTGFGQKRFAPDDAVTYEQALTMMVNALKLGEVSGKMGGYPDGYIAVADGYGLLEGVNGQKGNPQTRGDIAIMLMNYRDASTGNKLGAMGKGHYNTGEENALWICIDTPKGNSVHMAAYSSPVGPDGWDWDAVIAGNGIFFGLDEENEGFDPVGYIKFRSKTTIEFVFVEINDGDWVFDSTRSKYDLHYSSEKMKFYDPMELDVYNLA